MSELTHCFHVIHTGNGCREWPGDSADDWYRGACYGQLCSEPGGVSESPDLHTDSGILAIHIYVTWLKSFHYYSNILPHKSQFTSNRKSYTASGDNLFFNLDSDSVIMILSVSSCLAKLSIKTRSTGKQQAWLFLKSIYMYVYSSLSGVSAGCLEIPQWWQDSKSHNPMQHHFLLFVFFTD